MKTITKKEIVVDEDKVRIDQYLSNKLPHFSRTKIKNLIKDKMILVNQEVIKPSYILREKQKIKYIIQSDNKILKNKILPEKMDIEIIFEDEYFVVINKSSGIIVHPGNGNPSNTLVNGLVYHFQELSESDSIRPGIVHRLDKDTTGLILVAKDDNTHNHLSELFQQRKIKKTYKAIVWGKPKQSGEIRNFLIRDSRNKTAFKISEISGKEAITNYELLDNYGPISYVKLLPKTGRTHQLRVHMKYIGTSILGDDKYSGGIKNIKSFHTKHTTKLKKTLKLIDRQMLHAESLTFLHPFSKEKMHFSSDLPTDMQNVRNLWKN